MDKGKDLPVGKLTDKQKEIQKKELLGKTDSQAKVKTDRRKSDRRTNRNAGNQIFRRKSKQM